MLTLVRFRFFFIVIMLYALGVTRAQAITSADVVVSISPLQALVSGVMKGVTKPTLLLDASQSPHHANLRPSQLRALNSAKLVFWIGPQMETFLPSVLSNLGPKTKIVALMENPQLHLLPLRNARNGSGQGDRHQLDPHIWLSTYNAKIMVNEIADQLSALDEKHLGIYQDNAHRMEMKMKALHKQLIARFKHGGRYLSYHDAFQYFEHEVGLHHVGSVIQSEELPPSAMRILELRQRIQQQHIRCVVYDAPFRPSLIDTLLLDSAAHATELDALGLLQKNDSRNWFVLMHRLSNNFAQCLGPQTSQN